MTQMSKNIYLVNEFAAASKLSRNDLKEWDKLNLVKPAGFTDQDNPFYTDASLERVTHVQGLLGMGYTPEDAVKILSRVGLPKTSSTKRVDESKFGKLLTVGQLSKETGLSPRTLKHWEEKGIIQPDMRSSGGFRLYAEYYVVVCKLIQDLQLFGYSLEEIRKISDYFRDFLAISQDQDWLSKADTENRLSEMLNAIDVLHGKMLLLEQGIRRWSIFLKRKDREIHELVSKNQKRGLKRQQSGTKK
jgi:DNA-binding transcriptional MerR regulator